MERRPSPRNRPRAHPTITEVLYDVPGRLAGDANKDGKRTSGGDEFIELANLSSASINLKGYTVLDSNAWEAGGKVGRHGTGQAHVAPGARGPHFSARPGHAGPRAGLEITGRSREACRARGSRRTKPRARAALRRAGAARAVHVPRSHAEAGGIVVVFNGMDSTVPGAVGTSEAAAGENGAFAGARVFSMKTMSAYAGVWATTGTG